MNRLWVRLATAFVLVTWAVLAIVAVVVYRSVESSFIQYVRERDAAILAEWRKQAGLGPSQIRNQLRRAGHRASRHRVARLMAAEGLVGGPRSPQVASGSPPSHGPRSGSAEPRLHCGTLGSAMGGGHLRVRML